MDSVLDVARRARDLALRQPHRITTAPIGRRYIYEDSRIRIRACDQRDIDDVEVEVFGRDGTPVTVLAWSCYGQATPALQPSVFIAAAWTEYVRSLAKCQSREMLDWRVRHWARNLLPPSTSAAKQTP